MSSSLAVILTGHMLISPARVEIITDETEEHARSNGRPLGSDDRLLLGRAIIRRVVGDHVRSCIEAAPNSGHRLRGGDTSPGRECGVRLQAAAAARNARRREHRDPRLELGGRPVR